MRIKLNAVGYLDGAGWAQRSLLNDEFESHERLSALNSHLMESFYEKLIENPGLTDFKKEFIKSSVRSIIRYSDEAKNFAKATISALLESNLNNQFIKNLYITPPYLIFHQPGDLYEKGPFHIDTIPGCGKMLTWWTPINQRQLNYPALTILQGSHKFVPKYMEKLTRKILPSIAYDAALNILFGGLKTHSLIPDKKSCYFWDSDLIHRGNHNTESSPHCALVFRISASPLYYEPANTLLSISQHKFDSNTKINIDDIHKVLIIMEEFANSSPSLTIIDENLISWMQDFRAMTASISPILKKHICFALTLISQRFPQNKLSPALDLMSYLIGRENLVGLERFLKILGSKSQANKMIDILGAGEFLKSYQEITLLKRLGIKPEQGKNPSNDLNGILGWI